MYYFNGCLKKARFIAIEIFSGKNLLKVILFERSVVQRVLEKHISATKLQLSVMNEDTIINKFIIYTYKASQTYGKNIKISLGKNILLSVLRIISRKR